VILGRIEGSGVFRISAIACIGAKSATHGGVLLRQLEYHTGMTTNDADAHLSRLLLAWGCPPGCAEAVDQAERTDREAHIEVLEREAEGRLEREAPRDDGMAKRIRFAADMGEGEAA
jgi:hypothetical protein